MINYIDNYFDLKLLRLSDLKLHEATENNRLRNIYNRLSKSKYLMNPVIAGKYNSELILLDGANRYGSLIEIGCKLILAQVLDYKSKMLKLEKWNHLVYELDIAAIKNFCNENNIKCTTISYREGLKILEAKFHYVLASDTQKDINLLIELSPKLDEMLSQLSLLTKSYFKNYSFDRSESDILISDLRKYSRKGGTLITFPGFTKSHIVTIAKRGLRLPAGISRHRIFNRVLHVKYEIKKLMNDKDLKSKQNDLKAMLIDKIDKNKVRQYQESVIVFDE